MTDFVYDNTDVPDGKSDASPVSGDPNQHISASEWNTVMQAVVDLRDAVLDGNYHGLTSDPAATVSASGKVKLRNNAGVLQASQSGGTYAKLAGAEIHASDYGVLADGTTDDSAALQAAINAATSLKRPLRLVAGVHRLDSPITLSASFVMHGTPRDNGGGGTVLRAGASMSYLVLGEGCNFSTVTGIEFDGNGLANVALQLGVCSFSVFDRCRFTGGLYDGVRLTRLRTDGVTFGLSDNNHFLNCDGYRNGVLFATSGLAAAYAGLNVRTTVVSGTVSCTSGSYVLTGVGTSFTSLGLRAGDFIRIGAGATPEVLMVWTVDSDTQITCGERQPATQSLSGVEYMIGRGAGYFEEYAPDTNINHLTGGIWRSNAACGIHVGGLYGDLLEHVQVDTCPFYGIAVNLSGGAGQTYATVISHAYLEGCEAAPFYLGAAYGISIISPMVVGIATPIHYSSTTFNHGTYLDESGISSVGGATNRMPTTTGSGFYNVGKFRQYVGSVSTAVAANTIDYDNAILQVATGGDVAYTSTPTLAAGTAYGQMCKLWNVSASSYTTVDDYRTRAGTKLRLKTPSVRLGPEDSIDLMWDQTYWTEINRSLRPVVGDSTGTPGNATQDNCGRGRAAFAAAAAAVTITNNLVTATSIIGHALQTVDGTLTQILTAVPGTGSFVITGNAAATGTTNFAWWLVE